MGDFMKEGVGHHLLVVSLDKVDRQLNSEEHPTPRPEALARTPLGSIEPELEAGQAVLRHQLQGQLAGPQGLLGDAEALRSTHNITLEKKGPRPSAGEARNRFGRSRVFARLSCP